MQRFSTSAPPASRSVRTRALAAVSLAAAALAILPSAAGADPALGGTASGYGVTVGVAGSEVIPPTPESTSTLDGEDAEDSQTLVDVPAEPLAISGTATARSAVHVNSDLESLLEFSAQDPAGTYNARAVGEIESAEVLVDVIDEAAQVSLLEADAVRAEAVAVCIGDTVTYSANSEIVGLEIGGTDLGLNDPVQDLIDAITGVLVDTTLDQVVSVERNVVTPTANGIAVDALRVTVLQAVQEQVGGPLAEIVLGHAELSDVTCGTNATKVPECSDGVDNADPEDELADKDDPGCLSGPGGTYNPTDNDETDLPECSDSLNNDPEEDDLIDANDPGCLSGPGGTYEPTDDDETDPTDDAKIESPEDAPLARTGGDVPLAAAMAVGIGGLGALHLLRRRSVV